MKKIKDFIGWVLGTNRCERCKGYLRRHGDLYFGAVEVWDTIGPDRHRTAFVCNLCYQLWK